MSLPPLVIGDLTIPTPIIQGGMGIGVSLSGLASAVANEGGVGVIATAGVGFDEPDFNTNFLEANTRALRNQIRRARSLTKGVLGVNIMVALTNYDDLVRTAVDEGIDIIFSGAGLPRSLPGLVPPGSNVKLGPIVSSARAASILCRNWLEKYDRRPDVVVVEGPKAGGHLGFKLEQLDDADYRLENLVPAVIDMVAPFAPIAGRPIPVIAAGGIYTGADIDAFLRMGASGVQMGTRFVATHECDADPAFKQAYLDAKKEDITIIKSPVGMPGRAIVNTFTRDVASGLRVPVNCPYHCIKTCVHTQSPFCIALALINSRKGNMQRGLTFAGANAYRVDAIISVAELMNSLRREYELCRNASLTVDSRTSAKDRVLVPTP